MRLFVALDVGEEVRRRAQRVIDRLERQLGSSPGGRVHPSSPVRWVRIDQLHLTLRFIGEVDDAIGAEIETRLAPAYPTAPFEIALAGVGLFPPSGAPRVVWIGLTDGIDRVREVQAETVRRLAGLPIRPDDRLFSPHLTLGRF
ncbi:MAG TPA: RNA 2',3'-cyclic phosphodiesterase, partial [Vicinamibacterales bacterium]|nr:RNA 2',3'-cyclic phosphodiesterase [Vicinamibacterales bacterium]